MATTIISCEGQGKPWQINITDDNPKAPPSCPACELTSTDLDIKVTRKTNQNQTKLSPPELPQHYIEREGTELRYILVSGNFQVHSATCKQPARDISQHLTDYAQPATLVAINMKHAITQLWDDQLRDQHDTPEDPDDTPESYLDEHGYTSSTQFHARCLSKVEGFQQATKSKANSQGKRDARRLLALQMIKAMASELNQIKSANLADAGGNGEESTRAEILRGMSNEEIDRTASHWVHHLPAPHALWAATGFPIPTRSDWTDTTAPQGNADTPDPAETDTPDNADPAETDTTDPAAETTED